MALCYTRLLYRRNIDFRQFRSLCTSSSLNAVVTKPVSSASTVCESYDEKNMRLKRPMSPHLTIYQIQLTSLLSITHRATGMILAGNLMFLGLGTLLIPGGIPCVIEILQATSQNWGNPTSLIFIGKYLMALPFCYHVINGFRHLAWDLGLFLTIKQVYSTGYIVAALSVITSLILAAS